jgi:hypothetical protein
VAEVQLRPHRLKVEVEASRMAEVDFPPLTALN